MATYTIQITNKTGAQQNYLIFNEAPLINDRVEDNVWLNVFYKKAVPNSQTISFKLTNKYSAVCGSADAKPGNNVSVSVGAPSPVTLGQADSSGRLSKPGTSYKLTVVDGAPQFTPGPQTPAGKINAFEILTDDSFTYSQAVNGESCQISIPRRERFPD